MQSPWNQLRYKIARMEPQQKADLIQNLLKAQNCQSHYDYSVLFFKNTVNCLQFAINQLETVHVIESTGQDAWQTTNFFRHLGYLTLS